jgi:hypothetical protein
MSNEPEEKPCLLHEVAFIIIFDSVLFLNSLIGDIRKIVALRKYQNVLNWVKNQNLPLDFACELRLPRYLACLSQRGTVYALHTEDDRYCILLKTSIYLGRENFYGIFYCDHPLTENDFLPDQTYDRPGISIEGNYNCLDIHGDEDYGSNFRELYVVYEHSNQLFEVDYTLN